MLGRYEHAAVKKKFGKRDQTGDEAKDHPIWTLLVLGRYGADGGTVSI